MPSRASTSLSLILSKSSELCEVGRRPGSLGDISWCWVAATETALKDLSELGRLSKYATVHFAMHRAL